MQGHDENQEFKAARFFKVLEQCLVTGCRYNYCLFNAVVQSRP